MRKHLFFITAFLLLICGCAVTSPTRNEADVNIASNKFLGTTYIDINQGYKLYLTNCGGCHQLHEPAEFTEQEWSNILPVMTRRAKLNEKERELILKFIVTTIEKKQP